MTPAQQQTPTSPQVRKAFLDALSWGESEPQSGPLGYGYNKLFGSTIAHPKIFSSFAAFPIWAGVRTPAGPTHAAGRYQFEPRTWKGQATKLHLPDFSPHSQDLAAWDLAATIYNVGGYDLEADLIAGETEDVAFVLNHTWTSLSETFPKKFKAALAAVLVS